MADLLGISGTQHTWNKTHASGGPCMTNPEKKKIYNLFVYNQSTWSTKKQWTQGS